MNTRQQLRGLLVLLMAVTVALGGAAVGYGLWQDQVKVQVGIASPVGDIVCFGFTEITTDDSGTTIDKTIDSPILSNQVPWPFNPGGYHQLQPPINKHVGATEAWLVGVGTCGANAAEMQVTNGYPSYASTTTIHFANFGPSAIMITAEAITLAGVPGMAGYYLDPYSISTSAKCYWLTKMVGGTTGQDPGDWQKVVNPGPPPVWQNRADGADNDGDGLTDEDVAVMDICLFNFEGEVVQPLIDVPSASIKLHVLQPAEQLATYKFRIWLEVWPV